MRMSFNDWDYETFSEDYNGKPSNEVSSILDIIFDMDWFSSDDGFSESDDEERV